MEARNLRKERTGVVLSNKMDKTITVAAKFKEKHPIYGKFVSKTKKYHEQTARFGGAEVFIKPASHGTGVVAGGAMRAVLESVGVTDVLAKSKGSSNPHNLVKATIIALGEMRDARTVAQNRGVSMDKVFRG